MLDYKTHNIKQVFTKMLKLRVDCYVGLVLTENNSKETRRENCHSLFEDVLIWIEHSLEIFHK